MNSKPYIIKLSKFGNPKIGYISFCENGIKGLPFFKLKRIYWTYFTPEEIIRGRHAHYKTHQILFAVSGKIVVETEAFDGERNKFNLDKPNKGLYIPPLTWHTMKYSHTSIQLVIASKEYVEKDYIRDYKLYMNITRNG